MQLQDVEQIKLDILQKCKCEVQEITLDMKKISDFWASCSLAQKDKLFLLQIDELIQVFLSYMQYMFYMDQRLYQKNIFIDNLMVYDFKLLNFQLPEPYCSYLNNFLLIQNPQNESLKSFTLSQLEQAYVCDVSYYQQTQSAVKIRVERLDQQFIQLSELYRSRESYTVIPKHLEQKFFMDFINQQQNEENYCGSFKLIPLVCALNHLLFNRLILSSYKCLQKKLRLQNRLIHKPLLSRKCFDNLALTVKTDGSIEVESDDTEYFEQPHPYSLDLLQVPHQQPQACHYEYNYNPPFQNFLLNFQRNDKKLHYC